MNQDSIEKERRVAAEVNYQLGVYLEEREANIETAIEVYTDCVQKDEEHVKCMLALA